MKTLMGLMITKYDDMRLVNPQANRYFAWRTFIYPFSGTKMTVRGRSQDIEDQILEARNMSITGSFGGHGESIAFV